MESKTTYEIGIMLCRFLAAYLLFCGVLEITYIPDLINSLHEYFSSGLDGFYGPSRELLYWRHHYVLWSGGLLVRLALNLAAGVLLWRRASFVLGLLGISRPPAQ